MKEKKKLIIAVVLVILLGILVLAIVNGSKDTSFKVTFDSHGGTEVESQKLKKGELIEIPEDPEKEGYEFIGWYYDGEKFDFSKKLDKSVKLEAKWLKVGTIKNTVTFDSAGGSRIDDQKVDYGKTAKKPENPVRTGYTFVEWTLKGKSYDFSSEVKDDITLVAVWKQNEVVVAQTTTTTTTPKPVVKPVATKKVYTVSFYSNNTKISSVEVVEGNTVDAPIVPVNKNYVFKGWQYQSQSYDFSQPVTKDMRIEAIWTPILDSAAVAIDTRLTTDTISRDTTNQGVVEVKKESNKIQVTKTSQLTAINSILNNGTTSSWVALNLDLGEKPDAVEVTSEAVAVAETDSVIAILDTELNQNVESDFVVWIDADQYKDGKYLTFKNGDKEIGTVFVIVDYQKLQPKPVKVTANSKVTITVDGNTITVLELPVTPSSYDLTFELDFGTKNVSASGTTSTSFTDPTAMTAIVASGVTEVSFSNTLAPNDDKITYTIVYQKLEVVTTEIYPKNGEIQIDSKVSDYVVYNSDGSFTVAANISVFTFTDDGVEMRAIKDTTTDEWSFITADTANN